MTKLEKIKKILKNTNQEKFKTESENKSDFIFGLKQIFKKIPFLYNILCYVFGAFPTAISPKKFIKQFNENKIILSIGSGPKIIRNDLINIDIFPYKNVDIVASAENLPINDSCVDAIICESLIEHLNHPDKLISEINRILKPDGYIYLVSPFIIGFHSSPNDYTRWTKEGLEKLFSNFKNIKIDVIYGPSSALANIASEWLAILFSFNIKILYSLMLILFTILLTPIRLFDFVLSHYSFSKNISLGFLIIAQKE